MDTLDPAPAPSTPSCPSGWVNAHTEGCFAFLTETKVTWEDAMVVCEKMGGYLAQPQTLAQMEFLTGLAEVYTTLTGVHNWWLGLSDIGHEGIWEWVHTMEEVSETYWAAGSPSGEAGNTLDCGSVSLSTGKLLWRDLDCRALEAEYGASISLVCQREEIVPENSTTTISTTIPTATTMTTPTTTTISTTTTNETITTTTTGPNSCPHSWIRFDKSCYQYNSSPHSWLSAQEYCQTLHPQANLAASNSMAENELLQKMSGWIAIWLGGRDIQEEGHWKWTDGSSFNYTNWRNGQPDGGYTQNCLYMDVYGRWADDQCSYLYRSFCELNLE